MTNEEAAKIIQNGLDNLSIDYTDEEQREAFKLSIKALKQVMDWIPVNDDNLPDYGEDVLVSVNMGSVCAVGMDMYSAVEKEGFEGYGKDVVAWMPLPKVYKADKENKE